MVGLERTWRTMSSEGSEDINMNSTGRTQERLKTMKSTLYDAI